MIYVAEMFFANLKPVPFFLNVLVSYFISPHFESNSFKAKCLKQLKVGMHRVTFHMIWFKPWFLGYSYGFVCYMICIV